MKATIGVLAFVLFSFAVVQAQNWPQWRGPSLNGISNEKNLPVKWSTANGPDVPTPVTDGKYFYVVRTTA